MTNPVFLIGCKAVLEGVYGDTVYMELHFLSILDRFIWYVKRLCYSRNSYVLSTTLAMGAAKYKLIKICSWHPILKLSLGNVYLVWRKNFLFYVIYMNLRIAVHHLLYQRYLAKVSEADIFCPYNRFILHCTLWHRTVSSVVLYFLRRDWISVSFLYIMLANFSVFSKLHSNYWKCGLVDELCLGACEPNQQSSKGRWRRFMFHWSICLPLASTDPSK